MIPIWVWFWETGGLRVNELLLRIFDVFIQFPCVQCCALSAELLQRKQARVATGQAGRAENQRPVWGSSYQQRYTECCRMMTQQILIFVDWDKALWHSACVCTSWCCHWNAILFRLVSVHCTPHSTSWALLLSPTSGVRLHVSLVK